MLRIAAASMFLVCSLLSIVFSIELFLVTSEVSGLNGVTDISGRVEDDDGEPLANVSVTIGDLTERTDGAGAFVLRGVPQGKVVLEIYKDGYVGERLGIVAYPDEERWMGDESVPNDLSGDPFVLYEEIEWQKAGKAEGLVLNHTPASSGNATLDMVLIGEGVEGPVRVLISGGPDSDQRVELNGTFPSRDISFELSPGKYNITIAGPGVLDRGIEAVDLMRGRTVFEMTLEDQDFFELWIDQDVRGNYLVASLYAVIGILCGAGTYLVLRTERWAALVLIATVAFFGRGPFDPFGFNLIPLFALGAMVSTILLRGDMMRKRPSIRPRPSERT